MADEQSQDPKYRGRYRPAPHPIVKPGAPLTWSEVRARMPQPDPDFLRDIKWAQSEDLLED